MQIRTTPQKPSYAAWKRRLAPGVTIKAENHIHPNLTGYRVVTKAQGDGFFYAFGEDHTQRGLRLWCDLPLAKLVRVESADTITILLGVSGDLRDVVTLTIVEAAK